MIAIVDYGMGNLRSVTNAFAHLGAPITVTREKAVIKDARAIVLPGVGAFGKCMENLKRFDLLHVLKEEILSGKPYLGICLGLQMLFASSEEAPGSRGHGPCQGAGREVQKQRQGPAHGMESGRADERPRRIFDGISQGDNFYFVHSYYPEPEEDVVATRTEYGERVHLVD